MIDYIRGSISDLNPTSVVLESAGGIGFRIAITLPTYTGLQGAKDARLWIHEIIREDAWLLFGFADTHERELFRSLIGVSGVGAVTAMLILSALQGNELAQTIAGGDVKRLKSIKGIGAKTAERIIVDLRDKIGDVGIDSVSSAPTNASVGEFDEALAALTMLGFDRKASHKVLRELFDREPNLKVEAAIKQALSMM